MQLLGFTATPYYIYNTSLPGTYTFVVKSAYSIFKSNASSGVTISADVNSGSIPSLPNEDTNNNNSEENENLPENVEVAQ